MVGSLPGPESLRRGEYYAQPRNSFWRIVSDLFGTGPLDDYPARVAAIERHGLALWDVCAAAERSGALDSAIRRASVEVNDFEGFFRRHRAIERVYCNGQTAAALYRRRVLPTLTSPARDLPVVALPSTSPANASMCYERKIEAWTIVRATVGTLVHNGGRHRSGPRTGMSLHPHEEVAMAGDSGPTTAGAATAAIRHCADAIGTQAESLLRAAAALPMEPSLRAATLELGNALRDAAARVLFEVALMHGEPGRGGVDDDSVQRMVGLEATLMGALAPIADIAERLESSAERNPEYEAAYVSVVESAGAMLRLFADAQGVIEHVRG